MKKVKSNFLSFENIKHFQKTRSWERNNILYVKHLILLFALIGNPYQTKAQTRYTISVPTARYTSISPLGATDALDIQHLIDEFTKYAKIYKKNICVKTLDPEISTHLKAEMKKIKEGTPYLLAVDYENCKFISLLPDKGTGGIASANHTIYRIMLYQDITSHSDFPSAITMKKDENSANKRPLLATYQDDKGKWIAMGPYMTTDPYGTENQALGSLYYADSDLTFLCQRGKFKIYALKGKVEHDSRDIRSALKALGINDIPE